MNFLNGKVDNNINIKGVKNNKIKRFNRKGRKK